ncbi:hypothetical protein RND71_026459 [Anisodus tanguticus]|uniref:NAC domain-containing protein n=1 Tax=Anisodus tanguticus TaxID=243964 RepID=A0AAE1VBA9_9SOLA|nr:hypothetical protein RND71_026459 [Anisodus tanguticus]
MAVYSGHSSRPMGNRFHPTESEVMQYLLGFVLGKPLPEQYDVMQNADLYADKDPWQIFKAYEGIKTLGDNGVEEFIDSILQDDEIAIGEENFIECMEGDEVGDHVIALLGCSYNEENIEEFPDDQGDNGVEEFIDSVLQDDEIAIGEENLIECMDGDEVGDHVLALLGCSYNEENIEEFPNDQGIMESKNLSIPFYFMMK